MRLEEICDKIVDGDHNPPKGLETPTQYLMISSRNINHDRIENLDNVRYLSKEIFEIENERTRLNVGDILFTSVGSLGRSCVYNSCYNLCFQRSVSIIHTLTYNYWVKYFFDSDYYQNLIIKKATGTAQMGFYLQQLSESYIALPPYNEQLRIVSEIEHWFALINDIETNKLELQEFIKQTKSKILDFAIHGKLVPQEPNDEPAIELLKRINPAIKPCDTSHYGNLPKGWCATTFEYLSTNIASKKYQIKQSEINESGKYPVISQSANFIEGYSDANSKLLHIPSPIIVFGDHTRITKYIDFDFIVGADGVKILLPLISAKYYYYLTQYVAKKIENRGYSRHYSYLSRYIVPLPPRVEQERIALRIEELFDVLDKISADL